MHEARATVSIAAGQHLGLTDWVRFEPGREKFLFSDYLQLFLEAFRGPLKRL